MKPFFEDPALTLYQGDALAVLQSFPPLCVDAVITDPPYSSGGLMLSARQADPAVKYQNNGTVKTYPPMFGDNRDQRSFIMWATLWLAECWRVARDGSPLLMFSDWRQLPAMTDAAGRRGLAQADRAAAARGVPQGGRVCDLRQQGTAGLPRPPVPARAVRAYGGP